METVVKIAAWYVGYRIGKAIAINAIIAYDHVFPRQTRQKVFVDKDGNQCVVFGF